MGKTIYVRENGRKIYDVHDELAEVKARYAELEEKYNDLGWRMKTVQRENDDLKAFINKESK